MLEISEWDGGQLATTERLLGVIVWIVGEKSTTKSEEQTLEDKEFREWLAPYVDDELNDEECVTDLLSNAEHCGIEMKVSGLAVALSRTLHV
ncbi:MAG: hypothetical protein QGH20_04820 [Candidatus Latescibacteria bacterium]|nr:hypothetical protein [Candidatus Latescibacterota bacterium]